MNGVGDVILRLVNKTCHIVDITAILIFAVFLKPSEDIYNTELV